MGAGRKGGGGNTGKTSAPSPQSLSSDYPIFLPAFRGPRGRTFAKFSVNASEVVLCPSFWTFLLPPPERARGFPPPPPLLPPCPRLKGRNKSHSRSQHRQLFKRNKVRAMLTRRLTRFLHLPPPPGCDQLLIFPSSCSLRRRRGKKRESIGTE